MSARGPSRSRAKAELLAASVLAAALLGWSTPASARPEAGGGLYPSQVSDDEPESLGDDPHQLVFPVIGEARLTDDWHAPRDNGARLHVGNDIGAAKHSPVVAVTDGVIVGLTHSNSWGAGNMLVLEGSSGWRYHYMHLNNDTPGTDDGKNRFEHAFADGIAPGTSVEADDIIGFVGDSGNAEPNTPHLHFEIHRPDGSPIDPHADLLAATPLTEDGFQYLCRGYANTVFGLEPPADGSAVDALGDLRVRSVLDGLPDVVDLAFSDDRRRMWALTASGTLVINEPGRVRTLEPAIDGRSPLVAVEPTHDGGGYWLLSADGHVGAFGSATDLGPTLDLGESEAVDLVGTPTGRGYLIVTGDGAVHAYGDAVDHGSPNELEAAATFGAVVIGMSPDASGYWLLADDGRVAAFGAASFRGRQFGGTACEWKGAVAGHVPSDGAGWWVIDSTLQAWAFGSARGASLVPVEPLQVGFAIP